MKVLVAVVGGCEASSRGQQDQRFPLTNHWESRVRFTSQACGFIDLAEHGRPRHLLLCSSTSSSYSFQHLNVRFTVV
ncbi:hypothetical protein E2C01_019922 [Portunus trituberculatus]|uniref:Uncharacterized protein n=1 Tax=Portunus trituberculatus TaxID=210409 RepID=A0A5B7DZY2_PORTR|nr:hypothetical protein [Portunus trituberculatus]